MIREGSQSVPRTAGSQRGVPSVGFTAVAVVAPGCPPCCAGGMQLVQTGCRGGGKEESGAIFQQRDSPVKVVGALEREGDPCEPREGRCGQKNSSVQEETLLELKRRKAGVLVPGPSCCYESAWGWGVGKILT